MRSEGISAYDGDSGIEQKCEKKPLRVLHLVNYWGRGGVVSFIERLVAGCNDAEIEQSILSICNKVESPVKCSQYGPMHNGDSMSSMLMGAMALGRFLELHPFDVIHIHTQNSSGFLYAYIAKRHGIPKRIIHSHSSALGEGAGVIKRSAQIVFRRLYGGSETIRLACSESAGKHLFNMADFRIIPNGIATEKYRFDLNIRARIRTQIGIAPDEFLVGCVGALTSVKNHMRALLIFSKLLQHRPNSKLLILGEGELRSDLEKEATRLGIRDKVSMPGFVDDVYSWYNAMDVVLFPSLYEGFPISLVEAQCNGLPVVCSDTISREVALLDTCVFCSLSDFDEVWVDALLSADRDRSVDSVVMVKDSGFDKENTMNLLLDIYKENI